MTTTKTTNSQSPSLAYHVQTQQDYVPYMDSQSPSLAYHVQTNPSTDKAYFENSQSPSLAYHVQTRSADEGAEWISHNRRHWRITFKRPIRFPVLTILAHNRRHWRITFKLI